MYTHKDWINARTKEHHAGRPEIGLSVWEVPRQGIEAKVFSWIDSLAVGALAAHGLDVQTSACLVAHGLVKASCDEYEAMMDGMESPDPALIMDVVRTPDGHRWRLVGDMDVLSYTRDEFPSAACYSIGSARAGRLCDDDLVTRVRQLLTSEMHGSWTEWAPVVAE